MKKIIPFIISFTLFISLFSSASAIGKINCENISLMSTYNLASDSIENMHLNDTISIIESHENYLKIKSPSGKIGWIDSYFVNEQPKKYFVNTTDSNVILRRSPSIKSTIVGQVKPGDKITYLDTFHSWYILDYNGMEVFVASWLGDIVSNGENNVFFIDGIINIRNSPTLEGKIISKGNKLEAFTFWGEEYGWFKIGLNSGYGYAAAWLMSYGNNYFLNGTNEYKYTTDNLRLRDDSSLNGKIIEVIPKGTKLRVLQTIGNWDRLISPTGKIGFSFNDFLKTYLPLDGKTVLLDPGHGGKDPGAISSTGQYEKYINLKVALKTKKNLEDLGATVLLTRKDDSYISRIDRAQIANKYKPDIFLSIHHNALDDGNYFGMSTYYDTLGNKSGYKSNLLANAVYDSVVGISSVYRDGIHDVNYEVLRNTNIPASLIEIGFISNKWEEKNIHNNSFQDQIAKQISLGILNYFMFKVK